MLLYYKGITGSRDDCHSIDWYLFIPDRPSQCIEHRFFFFGWKLLGKTVSHIFILGCGAIILFTSWIACANVCKGYGCICLLITPRYAGVRHSFYSLRLPSSGIFTHWEMHLAGSLLMTTVISWLLLSWNLEIAFFQPRFAVILLELACMNHYANISRL